MLKNIHKTLRCIILMICLFIWHAWVAGVSIIHNQKVKVIIKEYIDERQRHTAE